MNRERLIQRILRVDHAGEHGAVAIYSAQVALARRWYPELLPWLEATIAHEREHRAKFLAAMPARGAKPCRLLAVWSVGGGVLGALTGLLGRTGVMTCTAAVEKTVHDHLVQQLDFLAAADPDLAGALRSILKDEDQHLADAQNDLEGRRSLGLSLVSALVAAATEALIFISTRGDSLRLREALTTPA